MDFGVLRVLGWSGLIALATVLLCAAPALAWSTWMGRQRWRTSALLDVAVLLPAGLPPALVALALWLGWRQQDLAWLWEALAGWTPAHFMLTTLLACCLMTLPWMIRLLRPAFEEVDPWLVPAARTLGLSPWRTWWRISLPMARQENGLPFGIQAQAKQANDHQQAGQNPKTQTSTQADPHVPQ